MNKWYFGVPILFLVIFGFVFWQFDTRYEAAKARELTEQREAQAAELREQMQERLRAAQEAKRIADENRRIREEEKAREERERAARQEAITLRDDVASELGTGRRKLDDVRAELQQEEGQLKKIQDENAFLTAEQKFLSEYVSRAENNAARMLSLVEKIDAAAARVIAEVEAAKTASETRK